MQTTLSEENYLKAIFHLSQKEGEQVSNLALASSLQTKPASVTGMLKKLGKKELIIHEPYKGVELTAAGHKTAMAIIRKHRLWEYFLVEKLGFGWDEVHEVAEQLEHVDSPQLIDRLDDFLGSPTIDPHGDPIPDKDGKLRKVARTRLDEMPLGAKGPLVAASDEEPELLQYLESIGLELGAMVEVKKKVPFDGSMTIGLADREINISEKVTQNLWIEDKESR